MIIRQLRQCDLPSLFQFWKSIGEGIPYFFAVSFEKWRDCFLDDRLNGEPIFDTLETYLAIEDEQVFGLIQLGNPCFAWDDQGCRVDNPLIGVIRQLFFDDRCPEVGKSLLEIAEDRLACFGIVHAFYHILGMSCNAYHGKLHCSQQHVDTLLFQGGYRLEHENVYYVLDMAQASIFTHSVGKVSTPEEGNGGKFLFSSKDGVVGKAIIRYVDDYTEGSTRDCAYLSEVGIKEGYRGQGLGTEFLEELVQVLYRKGYRYLHTDTAKDNLIAQKWYEKQGFRRQGFTRSYCKLRTEI